MKTIKRSLAKLLAVVMMLSTFGNVSATAYAIEDPALLEEGTDTVSGVQSETDVALPEDTATGGDASEEQIATGQETAMPNEDGEGSLDVNDEELEIVSGEETETDLVNELQTYLVIYYDTSITTDGYAEGTLSSYGEVVDLSIEPAVASGSTATPASGYIFSHWEDENGNAVSADAHYAPDAAEIAYLLENVAPDADGNIYATYTAQFKKADYVFEKELTDIVRVTAYLLEETFDTEVELSVRYLAKNTREYQEAQDALIDAGKEFGGMMAFDIHFEEIETGEEIEPAGPVRIDIEVLRKAINRTDGFGEGDAYNNFEVHHLKEDARGNLSVETVADTAGEALYGMEIEADGADNATQINSAFLVDSFSIFVITNGGNLETGVASAYLYKADNNGSVQIDGKSYSPAGTANATFDFTGSPVVATLTDDSGNEIEYIDVYRYDDKVVEWLNMTADGGKAAGGMWIATKVEGDNSPHNYINTTWANPLDATAEYRWIIEEDNANDDVVAYVYVPGAGANKTTIAGKDYVPASPEKVKVTFENVGGSVQPKLDGVSAYKEVWYVGGDAPRKVNSFTFDNHNAAGYDPDEQWVVANVAGVGKVDYVDFQRATKLNNSEKFVWLLDEPDTKRVNATRYKRVYDQYGKFTVGYGTFDEPTKTTAVFKNNSLTGKADAVLDGYDYNSVYYRDGNGGSDYTTRYVKVDHFEVVNPDSATDWSIVAYLDSVDDRGDANGVGQAVYYDAKGDDNSDKFVWLLGSTTYEQNMISAKIYLRYDNAVPAGDGFVDLRDDLHAVVSKGKYGPSGNNKPYFWVDLDLGQALVNGAKIFSWDEINQSPRHQYYTYLSSDWKNQGAAAGAGDIELSKDFFVNVLYPAMTADSQQALLDTFGYAKGKQVPNYDGYVLKWEEGPNGDYCWHIDGAVAEKPSFLIELYEGTPNSKNRDLLSTIPSTEPENYSSVRKGNGTHNGFEQAFEKKFGSGLTVTWDSPDAFDANKEMTGTIITATGEQKRFTITAEANNRDGRSNIIQSDATKDSVDYKKGNVDYHAITEGIFYLAIFTVNYADMPTGNIAITKIVDDQTRNGSYDRETYVFNVLDKDGNKVLFNRNNDGYVYNVKGALEAVEIRGNGTVEITGMPEGSYTVAEIEPPASELETKGHKLEVSYSPSDKVEVKVRETAEVEVTNTITELTGRLILEKEFTGLGANRKFVDDVKGNITFTLYDANGQKVYAPGEMKTWDTFDFGEDFKYEWMHALGSGRFGGYVEFDNVPPGTYYAIEKGAEVDDYTLTTTGAGAEGMVTIAAGETKTIKITNDYSKRYTSVKVVKYWDDQNDVDGVRPDAIMQLYANDAAYGEPVTLKDDGKGNWTYTWENLPLVKDNVDQEYDLKEVGENEGILLGKDGTSKYVVSYRKTGTKETGYNVSVKNTYTPETALRRVEKVWDDANNQDRKRPTSVTVRLYADGAQVDNVVLNESNGWKHAFENLPKYKEGGKLIVYTITEDAVSSYETKIDYNAEETKFTVTNSYKPGTRSVSVRKVWNDDDNRDGLRNDATIVMAQLYKKVGDGKEEAYREALPLNKANNWQNQWANLPEKEDGQNITYTVKEAGGIPAGYDSRVTGNMTAGFTITNTHTPERTKITVTKVWNDNNDQDGKRLQSVTVQLYANGQVYTVADTDHPGQTVNAGKAVLGENMPNGLTYTWNDLKVYENGEKIEYVVKELDEKGNAVENNGALNENYVVTYTGSVDAEAGVTVTNTHTIEKTALDVVKTWNDADNQDGVRPTSINVELYKNGNPTGQRKTLNAANNWSERFADLDRYENKKEITYSVVETSAIGNGYKSTVKPAVKNTKADGSVSYSVEIVNERTVEKTKVVVSKKWNDNNNQDGERPEKITVRLLADGREIQSKDIEADVDGNWETSFDNLDKYRNGGVEILYAVTEDAIAGYTMESMTETKIADGKKVEFVNKYAPGKTSVTVVKQWDDNDDSDGLRPDSVIVTLLADGEVATQDGVDAYATLNEDNNWSHTWTDLDEKSAGKAIDYTIAELAVDGYEVKIAGSQELGYVITNTHTPEETRFKATKVWEDKNDQDGVRPASVQFQLFADGEAYGAPKTVTGTAWTAEWSNLPKYADGGKTINYMVKELAQGGRYALNAGENFNDDYVVDYTIVADEQVTVINKHDPEKTALEVVKIWNDDNDRDGVRPDSITVELLKNNAATGKTLELTKDNNYTDSFTDLDLKENGKEIAYTVKEVKVDGYTSKVGTVTKVAGNNYRVEVTNTHTPEKTQVRVLKVWEDNDNQDGARPVSVVVKLYADGAEVDMAELNGGNAWTYVFDGLMMYAGGEKIDYTVKETTLPEGYVATITGSQQTQFVITNTYEPKVTSVKVTKVWNDGDDVDGVRPEIKIQLLADGEPKGEAVALTENDGWTHTFSDLPVLKDGNTINYTIKEVGETDGVILGSDGKAEYVVSYSQRTGNQTDGYAYTVTNKYTPKEIDIPVEKVWDDVDNQDGKRPQLVTARLLADGKEIDSVELKESNNWKHTFTGLAQFKDNGTEIVYTITEDAVADYVVEIVKNDEGKFIITNRYTPGRTSVTVTKAWDDDDNRDGLRNDATIVMMQLYADGKAEGEAVGVSKNGSPAWTYTWQNLPMKKDGKDITYTVKELDLDGNAVEDGGKWTAEYTASYEGDQAKGFIVTNNHTPEETTVTAKKVFVDNDDQDGKRPAEIKAQLFANGEAYEEAVALNEANGWTYTWNDLKVYENGGKIEYVVKELDENGDALDNGKALNKDYVVTYSGSADDTITITNTHEIEKTEIDVVKTWDDDDNRDGLRKDVTVKLLADGKEVATLTLKASNGWSGQFANLDRYANGEEIVYTIEEVQVDGYTVDTKLTRTDNADGTVSYAATITNKHEIILTQVEVTKNWNDANNQDGVRPASITVRLYADGKEIKSATVTATDDWKVTFDNLPMYRDGGQEILYTVSEDAIEDYSTKIEGDQKKGYEITNTYAPGKTSVTVTKVWNDADNRDGSRPDSVTIALLADGEQTGDTVTLDESNNWSATFENLDKKADGEDIVYDVKEVGEANGQITFTVGTDGAFLYDVEYDGDQTKGYTVTNSYNPPITTINVIKIWDDGNNVDGLRHDAVKVQLFDRGEPDGEPVTLNDANGWKHAWTRTLWSDSDFTVREYDLENGRYLLENGETSGAYKVTYGEAQDGALTITNKHEQEMTEVPVEKVWDDDDDRDGVRPAEITVALKANGEDTDKTLTLTAEKDWKGAFTDLPKFEDGKLIAYTVTEPTLPAGYASTVTGDQQNGYVITNKRDIETTKVDVTKVWDDQNDQDGYRAQVTNIVLTLYADGEFVKTAVVTDGVQDDTWTYTFTDLPKFAAGKEIVYAVDETPVPANYVATVEGDQTNGFTITNTYVPGKVKELVVRKIWKDNDNQDGLRPETIKIQLYADGEAVAEADGGIIALSEANDWKGAFTDLPMRKNGKDVDYTVKEVGEENNKLGVYNVFYSNMTEYVVEITNEYTPETVNVPVKKEWVDANNQDRVRPTEIVVKLLANGTQIHQTVLNEKNNWEDVTTFVNLPKKENGVDVVYTVVEETVDGYAVNYEKTATGGYVITNTYKPGTTNVTVTKSWQDDNNRDGLRNANTMILVTLYADGEEADETTLSADNDWTHTWSELPEKKDGETITYTVKESNVPDGYTSTITGDQKAGYVITNRHTPERTTVKVTKVWDDNDNQDGKRLTSVQVQLFANGEAIGDIATLTESNNWTYRWNELYAYENGARIAYTVKEVGDTDGKLGDDYTVTYSDLTADESGYNVTVTNKHEIEKTYVDVTKVWDDDNDRDGIRPASIEIKLYADGKDTGKSLTLVAGNNWSGRFDNLDRYNDGEQIAYSLTEIQVDGYETLIVSGLSIADDGSISTSVTITNVHEPEETEVPVKKTWKDENNQDGKRPKSVTIRLFANGAATGDTLTLSDANEWNGKFEGLKKYKNGEEIVYTITEDAVTDYQTAIAGDQTTGYEVVNSYAPGKTSVTVTKTWDDDNNRDGLREAIDVTLTDGDGENVYGTATLSDDNNWTYTWNDLDEKANGVEIDYTVVETVPQGYTATVTGDKTVGFVITNKREITTTEITVVKTFDDNDNQDGKRPASVRVQLFANNAPVGDAETLNESNQWTKTWSKLPVNENGAQITYAVKELIEGGNSALDNNGSFNSDYKVSYGELTFNGEGYEIEIVNAHEPETTEITAVKIWDDKDDADGFRPENSEITFTLYKTTDGGNWTKVLDDEGALVTVTLNEDNNLTATVEDLPKYDDGDEITYAFKEEEVPAGYEVSAEYGATLTNTRRVTTTEVNGEKIWEEGDDAEQKAQNGYKRPSYIEVQLTGTITNDDGETETVSTATQITNEKKGWKYGFTDLPKYKDGKEITYTISEVDRADNVDAYYSVTNEGVNIINTLRDKEELLPAELTVKKIDSETKNVLGGATFTLYDAEGNEVDVKTTDAENGTVTFKFDKVGTYTLEETTSPEGYQKQTATWTIEVAKTGAPEVTTIEDTDGATLVWKYQLGVSTAEAKEGVLTVENPPVVLDDLRATKIWDDEDNKEEVRPESIDLVLYEEGGDEEIDRQTIENALEGNEQTVTFKEVPAYRDGKEIKYVVYEEIDGKLIKADGIANDDYKATFDRTGEVTKVTNRHVPSPDMVKTVNDVKAYTLTDAGETVTFKLETTIPEKETETQKLTEFTIYDTLVDVLEFRSAWNEVKVTVEGVGEIALTRRDVVIDGQKLEVWLPAQYLAAEYQGRKVTVAFDAGVKEDKQNVDALAEYLTAHDGVIENEGSYTTNFPNVNGTSDKVKVIPPHTGEKEADKEILTNRNEPVVYTIKTTIPAIDDLTSFVVRDTLEEVLEFVGDESNVAVTGANQCVVTINGKTLTVSYADAEYLATVKGQKVEIKFTAKIADDVTAEQLNQYLVAHDGTVDNVAKYSINNGPEEETNIVPVVIPPEIEKEVDGENGNKTLKELASLQEDITYTIKTVIPKKDNLTNFTIADTLEKVLEFRVEAKDVTVTIGGQAQTGLASINGQTLTVEIPGAMAQANVAKEIVVIFKAGIVEGADLSGYETTGGKIPNTAGYKIDNDWTYSDPVYVTPPTPFEKEVNGKAHEDLNTREDQFTYAIKTEIPRKENLSKFEIEDVLEPVLEYVKDAGQTTVNVTVGGTKTAHPVADGASSWVDGVYTVRLSGQKLTVEFEEGYLAEETNHGRAVEVTFTAQIKEGADLSAYDKVEGKIPNTARYIINDTPGEATATITSPPEIEKEVDKQELLSRDETITYTIKTAIPQTEDLQSFAIEDTLEPVLTFKNAAYATKVATTDDRIVDMSAYTASINGQTLRIEFNRDYLNANKGQEIKVSFEAVVKDNADLTPYYVAAEDATIVENTARYLLNNRPTVSNTVKTKIPDEPVTVEVEKVWSDYNDAFNTRPAEITARLIADGQPTDKSIKLNAANNWKGSFTDLPEKKNGTKINYTVTEDAVTGYTAVIRRDTDDYKFVITNTADNGRLTVVKSVRGLPAGTGAQTYSFIITNATTGAEVTRLTVTGAGSQTISVPAGSYRITEVDANTSGVTGYTMTTTGSGQTVMVPAGGQATATVINTYSRPTVPPPTPDPTPTPTPTPPEAPPVEEPLPAVLGARRTDADTPMVAGARRGQTGDTANTARRLMNMFMAGASAIVFALVGRKKKNEDDAK